MTLTRRGFLTASAAVASAPVLSARGLPVPAPREADIVVIGAGAAGIAAARRIQAAGRKVIVLEADSRIGGRCVTDAAAFDRPFDRGAQFLHDPDGPLPKLARAAGLDVAPVIIGQKIRIGRRFARAGETEEFLATLVRANRAIEDAARGRLDTACGSALPKDLGDWQATTEFVLGAGAFGKDLKQLSAMDKAHAQDRSVMIACRQGLGSLIARLGDGLPVSSSTPATRIVWSTRDVSVETPAGKVAARAAILTVSTNVLVSGAIKFAPDLPKRQLDAAARLSLGSYDRIALSLPGNPVGLAANEMMIEQSRSTRTAMMLANVGGSSLCLIDVAGSFGRDLSAQGEQAMAAFGKEWLAGLFGSETAAVIKKTAATRWNAAPYVLGAMSAAEPGAQPSRRILAEPVGSLFIAGEATQESLFGTVDGAWDSGERAAEAALRKIGALADPEAGPVAARPSRPTRPQRRRTASPLDR